MKKIIYISTIIILATSCTALRNATSTYDPYENRVVKYYGKETNTVGTSIYESIVEKAVDIVYDTKKNISNKANEVTEKKQEQVQKKVEQNTEQVVNKVEKNTEQIIKTEEKELNIKLEDIVFTQQEKTILELFKTEYNLVESKEDIIRKTKESILQISKKNNKKIKNLEFIKEVNEVLKTTKTKSYTLAVTRVINGWNK